MSTHDHHTRSSVNDDGKSEIIDQTQFVSVCVYLFRDDVRPLLALHRRSRLRRNKTTPLPPSLKTSCSTGGQGCSDRISTGSDSFFLSPGTIVKRTYVNGPERSWTGSVAGFSVIVCSFSHTKRHHLKISPSGWVCFSFPLPSQSSLALSICAAALS